MSLDDSINSRLLWYLFVKNSHIDVVVSKDSLGNAKKVLQFYQKECLIKKEIINKNHIDYLGGNYLFDGTNYPCSYAMLTNIDIDEIRTHIIPSILNSYYESGTKEICPFLDSLLLGLDFQKPGYLQVILSALFAKDLLLNNIPFVSELQEEYKLQDVKRDLFKELQKVIQF